jgi:GAF domain-containing protein
MNVPGQRLRAAGTLAGEAIRLQQTLRCDDARLDPRVPDTLCRTFGVRSVLAAVVRDQAGPVGVLEVLDRRPGHFGAEEASSLELLAEALGAVIRRKRAA